MVVIKDMELPESCAECVCCHNGICTLIGKRNEHMESGRLEDCKIKLVETKNATCSTCKHYGPYDETCWKCDTFMTMYERKQE